MNEWMNEWKAYLFCAKRMMSTLDISLSNTSSSPQPKTGDFWVLHAYILLTKSDSFFCSNAIDYLLINITLSWKTSYLKESLLSDQTFISIFILSVLLQRSISFIEKIMMKFAQSCPTLCDPMDYTYSPWNSLGQNTGVGSLSLL